jgi:hypothetical protein
MAGGAGGAGVASNMIFRLPENDLVWDCSQPGPVVG